MAGITLAQAEAQLALYLAAEEKVLAGQSYEIAGRKLILVFLDSAGKLNRIADAERVRRWVEAHNPGGAAGAIMAGQGKS